MIRVSHVKKAYPERQVFSDLSFTVNEGDVVGIIGASGSGKSSLLRYFVLLDSPDEGKIYLDDTDILNPSVDKDNIRKRIGMVFQNFNLFQQMCAVENVMSGMVHLNHIPAPDAMKKAMHLLRDVGLADIAFSYPDSLSGGQKQRVAIARTLALEPEIILFDEPTSSLDPLMKGEVEAVIKRLAEEGHTMILATHELSLLRQVCTKVLFLNNGVVWEEGTPEEIFDHAKSDETRRFVKALNVLEFNIDSKDYDFISMLTKIDEFSYKQSISHVIKTKLYSITEELVQMLVVQSAANDTMKMSFEYDRKDECIHGTVLYTGEPLDPDDPRFFISWPIICARASNISYGPANQYGFNNIIEFDINS